MRNTIKNMNKMKYHGMSLFWTLATFVAMATATATVERSSEGIPIRGLQTVNGLWDISEPESSYRGMQLDLDFTVRDQVRTEWVYIQLFRDDACTFEIKPEDNDYISIDIINDFTPFGDGSGERTITVNYNIDPAAIARSPIITFNSITIDGEVHAVVSFCTRFLLENPANPGVAVNFRDHIAVVGVDLTEDIGITGIITDEEDRFGAEAFECDENNNPIDTTGLTKNQGSRIRVCIQPDEFARGFGASLTGINYLTLTRGDVHQNVIVPQGVVKDLIRTEYICLPGQPICSVDAVISNDFYYSTGTVFGAGDVRLQYSFSIRGRRYVREKTVSITTGSTTRRNNDNNQIQRMDREAGGAIGVRPFSFNFEVQPSTADYDAVAFECDGKNQPVSEEMKKELKLPGDQVRICVMPNQEAVQRGVYVRAIASFFFEQGEEVQFAVEPTAKQAENGDTILICYPGQPLCAFKTKISDKFFNSWDPVVGTGVIYLQFGTELRPLISRQRDRKDRQLQITDAGFAGAAEVSVRFNVDPTYVPPKAKTWQDDVNDWWVGTPLFLRMVYIVGLIILVGLLFCILYGLLCGWDHMKRTKKDPDEPKVVVEPVYMKPNSNGNINTNKPSSKEDSHDPNDGKPDFCDCLSNPDVYHFDAAQAQPPREQPQNSRGMPPDEEESVPENVYVDDNSSLPSKFPDESLRSSYQDIDMDSPKPSSSRSKRSSKSPKPRRASTAEADDDGIRVSQHSKSPKKTTRKSSSINENDDDGIRVSQHSKSPKKKKKKRASQVEGSGVDNDDDGIHVSEHSKRSPRPGARRSSSVRSEMDGGTTRTPKSAKKKKSTKSPKSGRSTNSPGGRRATLNDPGDQSVDAPPF